jgi:hypothetical protein
LHYIGMANASNDLALAVKACAFLRAGIDAGTNQLQGNGSLQWFLTRPVNDAHAALTELFQQQVRTK